MSDRILINRTSTPIEIRPAKVFSSFDRTKINPVGSLVINNQLELEEKSIPSPYARIYHHSNAFKDGLSNNNFKNKTLDSILDLMELLFLKNHTRYANNLHFADFDLAQPQLNSGFTIEEVTPASINDNVDIINFLENLSSLALKFSTVNNNLINFDKIKIFYFINENDKKVVLGGTSPFTVFFTVDELREGLKIPGFFEYKYDESKNYIPKPINKRNTFFLKYLKYLFTHYINYTCLLDFKNALINYLAPITISPNEQTRLKAIIDRNINNNGELQNPADEIINFTGIREEQYQVFLSLKQNEQVFDYYNFKLSPQNRITHPGNNDDFPVIVPLEANADFYRRYLIFSDEMNSSQWKELVLKAIASDTNRNYLPGRIEKVKWLCPEIDFFEQKAILLPESLNSEVNYLGRVNTSASENSENKLDILIPLKEKYLEYFLPNEVPNYLSFYSKGDSTEKRFIFSLTLPTNSGNIEIRHEYYGNSLYKDLSYEKDNSKAGTYFDIWPKFQTNVINLKYYGIIYKHLQDITQHISKERINFFKYTKTNPNIYSKTVVHAQIVQRTKSCYLFSVDEQPDAIQFNIDTGLSGVILPKFILRNPAQQNPAQQNPDQQNPVQQNPDQQNPDQQIPVQQNPVQQIPFTHSIGIDFGTSNTIISFKQNADNNIQIFPLNDYKLNLMLLIENNNDSGIIDFKKNIDTIFYPFKEIPRKSFSTEVICLSDPIFNYTEEILDTNINLTKSISADRVVKNKIRQNLKWSGAATDARNIITSFLKELKNFIDIYLIDNNILPASVNYFFSYPLAFDDGNKRHYQNNISSVFGPQFQNNLHDESKCSAKYFIDKYNTDENSFNINQTFPIYILDIGGGTTDISNYFGSNLIFKSSVLYGGNDITNDSFYKQNSFINDLKTFCLDEAPKDAVLKNLNLRELFTNEIFDPYLQSNEKEKLGSSALFSLITSNEDVFDKIFNVYSTTEDFSKIKICLLYFFAGIFYYIGLCSRNYKSELGEVTHIKVGLAGNCSKFIKWIDDSDNVDNVSKFLEKFYNLGADKTNVKVKLFISENPKNEVVRGLLIDIPAVDKIFNQTISSAPPLIGEIILDENGTKKNSITDKSKDVIKSKDKIALDESKLEISDYDNSSINRFNTEFMAQIDQSGFSDSNVLLNQVEGKLYSLAKTDLINKIRTYIQSVYKSRFLNADNFNESLFLTEVKICLKILMHSLFDTK